MESKLALDALAALAQETRLAAFRRVVAAGPPGIGAGELAQVLGVLPNTLSSHLAQLARAGLLEARREGRAIRYRARLDRLGDLVAFLLRDCCGGEPGACLPEELAVLLGPSETSP